MVREFTEAQTKEVILAEESFNNRNISLFMLLVMG